MAAPFGLAPIAVVGSGNWGTTLALVQARAGRAVLLCCREREQARRIAAERENARSLPGVALPERVDARAGYAAAADAALIVLAVASEHVRAACRALAPALRPEHCLVSATKGLEIATALRISEVIAAELPALSGGIAVLSGPNLAGEIAAGLPAAAVLAAPDRALAGRCVTALATRHFRLYSSDDQVGVELGGALKNVVAIAAGICDGLAMGTNGKAAIVTRGMAEIVRLGRACGAHPLTFAGLSGYGDLFATCVSTLSRNHHVGEQIGRGRSLAEVLADMSMVAEGVNTARAARDLAARHGVEMPITEQVCQVLFAGKDPSDAMDDLLSRLARDERTGELL